MKQATFMEGVAVALAASVIGSVLHTALTSIFASDWVLRMLIAGIGCGYVVYLLSRSRERVGRTVTLVAWVLLAGALWLIKPSLTIYIVTHVVLIWFVRSVYFYSSIVPALIDLGLTGLSLAAAVWAGHLTGSVFLITWCFFLVQALFVGIPKRVPRRAERGAADAEGVQRFERAYQAAESALRKLAVNR